MIFHPFPDSSETSDPPPRCCVCGKPPAEVKLPFAVGREDSPPLPRNRRILGLIPLRKKFVQRHRWVWHFLWLCADCGNGHPSDRVWGAIQGHPATRQLVGQGFTETRLDPGFQGDEGEVTFTEEPV